MSSLTRNTIILLVIVAFVLCLPDCAWASFGKLTESGATIFKGLKKIIYPASAIGIICVCIGGFFGNINWKWLTVIIIGLLVISLCAGFIGMFTPKGAQPNLG